MTEARETIYLNEDKTERLRFIVDEDAEMPDDEGSPYSVLVYQPWSYRAEGTEFNASLSHASRELLMASQHIMRQYP